VETTMVCTNKMVHKEKREQKHYYNKYNTVTRGIQGHLALINMNMLFL
jgi:hypothetical protein